mmetsp:Transcript_135175/g.420103  ORF Transcript_135175/g.420103 Transcript_135175/m.420103 type:complete len:200 (+) Transcript_135175:156-755(+)
MRGGIQGALQSAVALHRKPRRLLHSQQELRLGAGTAGVALARIGRAVAPHPLYAGQSRRRLYDTACADGAVPSGRPRLLCRRRLMLRALGQPLRALQDPHALQGERPLAARRLPVRSQRRCPRLLPGGARLCLLATLPLLHAAGGQSTGTAGRVLLGGHRHPLRLPAPEWRRAGMAAMPREALLGGLGPRLLQQTRERR